MSKTAPDDNNLFSHVVANHDDASLELSGVLIEGNSAATGNHAGATPKDLLKLEALAKQPAPAGSVSAADDDPFDPSKLRIDHTSGAALGAQRVILNVPVRKPPPQAFIRVHSSPEMRLDVLVIDLKNERETYLVTPQMALALAAEAKLVRLYVCLPRVGGGIFLWPVRMPDDTGRDNPWNVSARKAAELGMKSWVRVQANMAMGCYDVMASDHIPEPEWPDIAFRELLRIAFGGGRMIDSVDHPIVRQLSGF